MPIGFLRVVAVLLGLAIAWPGATFAKDYWGTKLPDVPTQFLFGYGSLINTASRNSTATKLAPAIPVRVSANFGYIRSWIEQSKTGFTALGLRKPYNGETPTTINGVLYPVDVKDLPLFDERENGYTRVAVPLSEMEAVSWQQLPTDAQVWVYIPNKDGSNPEDRPVPPSRDYPIIQSYVDIVVEGAMEYGMDFARELLETTFDWNEYWLNDRQVGRRPWVHDKKAREVDKLMAATEPSASRLKARLFPEVYAVRFYGTDAAK
ncbi:MAG: gamma-glutamylcyclotransferase family protein [Rhodospirillaceae bacterium]